MIVDRECGERDDGLVRILMIVKYTGRKVSQQLAGYKLKLYILYHRLFTQLIPSSVVRRYVEK